MLRSIPGSRGGGSGLPGYHQINKVVITQSPPNRPGCMLMGKNKQHYTSRICFLLGGHQDSQGKGSVA